MSSTKEATNIAPALSAWSAWASDISRAQHPSPPVKSEDTSKTAVSRDVKSKYTARGPQVAAADAKKPAPAMVVARSTTAPSGVQPKASTAVPQASAVDAVPASLSAPTELPTRDVARRLTDQIARHLQPDRRTAARNTTPPIVLPASFGASASIVTRGSTLPSDKAQTTAVSPPPASGDVEPPAPVPVPAAAASTSSGPKFAWGALPPPGIVKALIVQMGSLADDFSAIQSLIPSVLCHADAEKIKAPADMPRPRVLYDKLQGILTQADVARAQLSSQRRDASRALQAFSRCIRLGCLWGIHACCRNSDTVLLNSYVSLLSRWETSCSHELTAGKQTDGLEAILPVVKLGDLLRLDKSLKVNQPIFTAQNAWRDAIDESVHTLHCALQIVSSCCPKALAPRVLSVLLTTAGSIEAVWCRIYDGASAIWKGLAGTQLSALENCTPRTSADVQNLYWNAVRWNNMNASAWVDLSASILVKRKDAFLASGLAIISLLSHDVSDPHISRSWKVLHAATRANENVWKRHLITTFISRSEAAPSVVDGAAPAEKSGLTLMKREAAPPPEKLPAAVDPFIFLHAHATASVDIGACIPITRTHAYFRIFTRMVGFSMLAVSMVNSATTNADATTHIINSVVCMADIASIQFGRMLRVACSTKDPFAAAAVQFVVAVACLVHMHTNRAALAASSLAALPAVWERVLRTVQGHLLNVTLPSTEVTALLTLQLSAPEERAKDLAIPADATVVTAAAARLLGIAFKAPAPASCILAGEPLLAAEASSACRICGCYGAGDCSICSDNAKDEVWSTECCQPSTREPIELLDVPAEGSEANTPKPAAPVPVRNKIVIDGSNVAMRAGSGECFNVQGLMSCVKHYQTRGFTVVALVPDHLLSARTVALYQQFVKDKVVIKGARMPNDVALLQKLVEKRVVFLTPSGDYDDDYIIHYAIQRPGCCIVTNDKYRDFLDTLEDKRLASDWLQSHLITYNFVGTNPTGATTTALEFTPNPRFQFPTASADEAQFEALRSKCRVVTPPDEGTGTPPEVKPTVTKLPELPQPQDAAKALDANNSVRSEADSEEVDLDLAAEIALPSAAIARPALLAPHMLLKKRVMPVQLDQAHEVRPAAPAAAVHEEYNYDDELDITALVDDLLLDRDSVRSNDDLFFNDAFADAAAALGDIDPNMDGGLPIPAAKPCAPVSLDDMRVALSRIASLWSSPADGALTQATLQPVTRGAPLTVQAARGPPPGLEGRRGKQR